MRDRPAQGADVEITRPADPTVVRVRTAAVREVQAIALEETLSSIAAAASGRLVVDLEPVQQLTSAGVNALVNVRQRCVALGGMLVLCGLSRDLVDLFKVTGLDRTLRIASHRDDAIMLFAGRKKTRAA